MSDIVVDTEERAMKLFFIWTTLAGVGLFLTVLFPILGMGKISLITGPLTAAAYAMAMRASDRLSVEFKRPVS